MDAPTLGTFGFSVDNAPKDNHLAAADEIERLGFRTLWLVGGQLDRLERLTDLLQATKRATVASAIIPPDVYDAGTVAEFYRRAEIAKPGRLFIGLGSPQRPGALSSLNDYVDQLDSAIPRERRLLAALGPGALDIARDRFAGAVPMLVTPAYTAAARDRLGTDSILAVGLYVVLDGDADRARRTARQPLSFLTKLSVYVKSLRRQGFSQGDIGSLRDPLIDRVVAWGSPADIIGRAREYLTAGADHVQLTVLGGPGQPTGLSAARLLGPMIG